MRAETKARYDRVLEIMKEDDNPMFDYLTLAHRLYPRDVVRMGGKQYQAVRRIVNILELEGKIYAYRTQNQGSVFMLVTQAVKGTKSMRDLPF